MADFFNNPFMAFDGLTHEELTLLQQATADLSENQLRNFQMIYLSKRKKPQDVLIFALLGLFCVAGIQRFVLGQVGMGVAYLLTAGFCGIGTIIDIINHKTLAFEFNRQMIYESYQMAKMGI